MWKGCPELQLMTPIPQIPGIPRIPRMNSRPMIPLRTSIEKSTLGALWRGTFHDFLKRAQKEPHGDPKGAKESPKAPQGGPKRTKGRTKEGQKEPNGVSRSCMAPRREFKGELYKQKLPINRPSGRYVIHAFFSSRSHLKPDSASYFKRLCHSTQTD